MVLCLAVAAATAYGIGRWPWLDAIDAWAHRWAPESPGRLPFLLAGAGFDLCDPRLLTVLGLVLALAVTWR